MKLKAVSGIMLTLLMTSIVMVLASPSPVIAQANPKTTVYLDPPTINGTVIGEDFMVNLIIRNAQDIYAWQAGLTFNATFLECTGFFEGEFLRNFGPTYWIAATINNTAGMIFPPYMCTLMGDYWASGDGRLAYATFKVKATGVSDIHLLEVKVLHYPDLKMVPINIIDVYTVVLGTTAHTVVTVSNSTVSDFYFSQPTKEIGFNVTGPDGTVGFCNVTIPSTLMWVGTLEEWLIKVDGIPLSVVERTITYNGTHYFIYFIYTHTTHRVQIFGTHVIGPPPEYTLTIYSSPTGVTFVVDGVSCTTPWSGTYGEGAYVSLVMPEIHDGYIWSHWLEDGDTNRIKTVTMDTNITLTAVYAPVPKPVGGKATTINIPTNKPELPALWIWLTILLPLAATTIFVKLKKKK